MVSSLILLLVTVCLGFACYNIYVYLHRNKLAKTLITAFYAVFVLMLLVNVPMWLSQALAPDLTLVYFKDNSSKTTYGSGVILAAEIWAKATYIQQSLTYSVYTAVVLTIQDLAMTICVLSGELSPAEYLRKRKWPYIVSISITVGYIVALVVIMCLTPKEEYHVVSLIVNLVGYFI